MLNAFRAEEMYVLPSFIDHRCFRPASMANGAGGRADIITNPTFQSKLLTDVIPGITTPATYPAASSNEPPPRLNTAFRREEQSHAGAERDSEG